MASVKGEVVSVAESGDLLTNVTAEQLAAAPRDESVCIRCDGHATIGIYPHDHDQPDFTFLALLNADDYLCLSLVGESASKFLGIKPGSVVTVSW